MNRACLWFFRPIRGGKGIVCRRLLDICPELELSTSMTTRRRESGKRGKGLFLLPYPIFRT